MTANVDQVAKNVAVSINGPFVHVKAFGLTLAEIRWDGSGLSEALRLAADVIDANAPMIRAQAKAYAEAQYR